MTNTYAIPDKTLAEQAVVFSVTLGALGQQRKISNNAIEIDADKDLIKASALLLDCPETKAIRSLDGEIRRYLAAYALPGPLKRGMYFLAAASVDNIEAKMTEFYGRRLELVAKLMNVYPQRCYEDSLKLRAVYNPKQYPAAARVEGEYVFTWQYLAIANPSALLSPELAKREREKMDAAIMETVEECRVVLRSELLDLVANLNDALNGTRDGGKPKIFRDSKVGNVIDFIGRFENRNLIAGDIECAKLTARVKQLLTAQSGNWIDPDVLREPGEFRAKVQQGFGEVQKELDAMLEDKPNRRRFRFGED